MAIKDASRRTKEGKELREGAGDDSEGQQVWEPWSGRDRGRAHTHSTAAVFCSYNFTRKKMAWGSTVFFRGGSAVGRKKRMKKISSRWTFLFFCF
jgi:hypothetical protein